MASLDIKRTELTRLEILYSQGDLTLVDRISALKSEIEYEEKYGAIEGAIRTVNSSDDIVLDDSVLLCVGGVGGITLTLPIAASALEQKYVIKKTDSGAGYVTIQGAAEEETIDGKISAVLYNQYDSITVVSDGTVWNVEIKTNAGYTLFVQADSSDPSDGETVYFCSTPQGPASNENNRNVVVLRSGVLKAASVIMNTTGGNAGTGENISLYIRVNGTTDYLIATVGTTDGMRVFQNNALNIPVKTGDTIRMKVVYPSFATNPTNAHWSGNLLIE